MKIFVSTNFTPEPLRRAFSPFEVVTGTFNDYRRILGGELGSEIKQCNALLLIIDGVELLSEVQYDLSEAAESARSYALSCGSFAEANPGLTIVATTVKFPCFGPASYSEVRGGLSRTDIEADVYNILAEASRRIPNLLLLDLARAIEYLGEKASFHVGMRYFGRFGLSATLLDLLRRQIKGLVGVPDSPPKKALAVDFDNTLWGGVVGDLGPQGIELSQEGRGRAFRNFQAVLKQLVKRGVLLVGLTKNNAMDVEEVFQRNDMMVLERDDFAVLIADWNPKSENVRLAAERLNIGLDSFVFVDDSAVERGAMKNLVPEVAVPDFPERFEDLPSWICDIVVADYFPTYSVTNEDFVKVSQYRNNAVRAEMKKALSYEEFLSSLDISLNFLVDDLDHAERISQMTRKTNQFNLTTRRYSTPEIAEMIRSNKWMVIAMSYADKLGEEGIVGVAIVDLEVRVIDSFLLSCRVIGRGVESKLMKAVFDFASKKGVKELGATFIPTPKNDVARNFLPHEGFQLMRAEKGGGVEIYSRSENVNS